MRRSFLLIPLLALAVAVPALAASAPRHFKGTTNKNGSVTFTVAKGGRKVVRFRFVNNCPSDSAKGNLVPGKMRIRVRHGVRRFSHKDSQFKITGHFVTAGKVRGTAQNDTGDCHSGKLVWTATFQGK